MGRKINQLTRRGLTSLTEPGRYGDGQGLYLLVDQKRHRRWVFRFSLHGRRRDMGLGSASTVKLGEARDLAEAARILLKKGHDPVKSRGLILGVPTFGRVADDLILDLKSGWRGKSTEQNWKRGLETQAKAIREIPVDKVDEEDVLKVLKPLWDTLPESAGKLRERIERVLDAAKAKGLRQGENPARWRGNLEYRLPPRRKLVRGHHRALPYDQIPGFMAALRSHQAISADALEWTILSCAREAMTTGARWREIEAEVWRIPGKRMKEGREHVVPITAPMRAILDKVKPRRADPKAVIFPGPISGEELSNAAMDALLRRMKVDAVPHGFRSTFRDWAGDCTDFPREIAEAVLAHVVGGDTERAYRRGDALDKRRKLMEAWASYCASFTPS